MLCVGVLHNARGYADFWRLVVVEPLGSFPVLSLTDEAIRKRLYTLGTKGLSHLYERICEHLPFVPISQSTLKIACFAREVVALDESTLDAVGRHQAELRQYGSKNAHLLAGKIAGLWDVRRQRWLRLQYRADVLAGCSIDVEPLLHDLPKGSMILEDLGYFGFVWLDRLQQLGYWYISRLRENGSYRIRHIFYENKQQGLLDALVWLGAYERDQAGVAVRLIEYRCRNQIYRYVTNVIDPQQLCIADVVELYGRRWDIECVFSLLKEHLGLHIWWSSQNELILVQLWVTRILAHVVQHLRFQVAEAAGVELFDVSLEILIDLLKRITAQESSLVHQLVEKGRQWKLIRPHSRIQRSCPSPLPHDIVPLPADVPLQRPAHYSHRNPHPRKALYTPRSTTQLLI